MSKHPTSSTALPTVNLTQGPSSRPRTWTRRLPAALQRAVAGAGSVFATPVLALWLGSAALAPNLAHAQSGAAVANDLRAYMNVPLAAPAAELEKKAKTDGVSATLKDYFKSDDKPTSVGGSGAYGMGSMAYDMAVESDLSYGGDYTASKGISPGSGYGASGIGNQVDDANSVIYKAFLMHPEWQKAVVVADWTGSMYPYTGMVLRWHKQNVDKQVISKLVLFNDGDDNKRGGKPKVAGSIGGIYHTDPTDIEALLGVIEQAVNAGDGGDSEENDIEALLSAQNKYPDAPYLILIADNSPIRDMELLSKIKKPVHVLLCDGGWVQDYVKLAYKTGGSVTLMADDIDFAALSKKPDFDPAKVMLNGLKYDLTK